MTYQIKDINKNFQKIKKKCFAALIFLTGDLYGIRTRECMRERHMS